MNNASNNLDLIKEIESKFDINSWNYDGINLWPLIKIFLGVNIFSLDMKISLNKSKSTPSKSLKKNTYVIDKKYDLILFSHELSKIKVDNSWYDYLMSPIIEVASGIGLNSLYLEYLNNPNTEIKLIDNQNNYFFSDNLQTIFEDPNNLDIKNTNWNDFDKFLSFLKQNIPNLQRPSIEKTIMKYKKISNLSKKLLPILKQVNPKLILMIDFYNEFGFAMTLAAKSLKIKTVDLQHGTIDSTHYAYNHWNCLSKTNYHLLPDFIWVWNDYSYNISINGNLNAIKGGHPFFNKVFFNNIQNKSNTIKAKILFTLQPDYNQELDRMKDIICDLGNNFDYLVKLHPCSISDDKNVQMYFDKHDLNVDVINTSSKHLYQLFDNVKYHITFYSSSCIEACSFNIPTIFLGQFAKNGFKSLFDTNWAISLNDFENIFKAIDHLKNNNKYSNDMILNPIDMKKVLNYLIKN